MKTILTFVCSMMLLGLSAQETHIIVFDFSDKTFKGEAKDFVVKAKSDLRIEVHNINLNKYEVEIDPEKRTFVYTASADEKTPDDKGKKSKSLALFIDPLGLKDSIDSFYSRASSILAYREGLEGTKEYLEEVIRSDLTQGEASALFEEYSKAASQLKAIQGEIDALATLYQEAEANAGDKPHKEIQAMTSKLEEVNEVKELIQKIEELIEKLSEEHFKAVFTITNVTSDELIVKLKIKEKGKEGEEIYSRTIYVKGDLKVNPSTGGVFSFGNQDRAYFVDATSSIALDKNKQKIDPLFPTVMMNFYWRNAQKVNVGGAFGFGLDSEVKSSYFLGLCFLAGEKQRVILSSGLSLRPASRLKGKYAVGQTFDPEAIPDKDDLVSDFYKMGGFFALTYNLTSKTE